MESVVEQPDQTSQDTAMPADHDAVTPAAKLKEYLLENLPETRDAFALREKGWKSNKGDEHFNRQRKRADNASEKSHLALYKLMIGLGFQINKATSAFNVQRGRDHRSPRTPAVLDLCTAPGGFACVALKLNPKAIVYGITLPEDEGGHKMRVLDEGPKLASRVNIEFLDITMLASEMGCSPDEIPADHPDAAEFSSDRPFADLKFDLVFCDGQVLPNQERSAYREGGEAARLTASQLVTALQRIRTGGTIVALMHQVDALRSFCTLSYFASFSELKLFKSAKTHATRSSFYLVATKVRPCSEGARLAIEEWKGAWKSATLDAVQGHHKTIYSGLSLEQFDKMLKDFGPQYLEMARPILAIQAEALRNAPWMN
ncbi:hypothetical protein PpBr36_08591 [Pyricularia pennisetigena]|uniref:hypothetical protein n=1 Tax=Pyricularia pennisetigena TaxID=1578925 RepID=UPI00114F4F04|nr:hypothetical protein PpBr36_08591 [Pyricularia pennisetigena]TLS24620.1 hypothetical protein PpBr36_08591 [Pyricularia pennisetigena]